MLKKEISIEEAKNLGISTFHEIMENGELRFRLLSKDGSSYIRTESKNAGWQNSHFHKKCKELYIVQQGWVVFVEKNENTISFNKITIENFFISSPMVSHNLYLSENTVIHTIKFGGSQKNDWYADKDLDQITLNLNEIELLKLCKQ